MDLAVKELASPVAKLEGIPAQAKVPVIKCAVHLLHFVPNATLPSF